MNDIHTTAKQEGFILRTKQVKPMSTIDTKGTTTMNTETTATSEPTPKSSEHTLNMQQLAEAIMQDEKAREVLLKQDDYNAAKIAAALKSHEDKVEKLLRAYKASPPPVGASAPKSDPYVIREDGRKVYKEVIVVGAIVTVCTVVLIALAELTVRLIARAVPVPAGDIRSRVDELGPQ